MRVAPGAAALLLAAVAMGPAVLRAPPLEAGPPPTAKKLLDTWMKAKKETDRAAARAAFAGVKLQPAEVADLRERLLDHFAKSARKVEPSGRAEWFDEKKDGWQGLYITSGKGKKGLVLAMHGGGAGSGDCGSAASSFSGPISELGYRGIYPEVLRKTEYGWTDPPETERWVMDLVKAARHTFQTDPNRVYLTGHSMGGYGTWTYGSIYADAFAAGAAFAGAPSVYWKPGKKDVEAEGVLEGYLPSLRNLPLFVYQSLDDPNVPAAANEFATAELAKLHEADPAGWKFVYERVNGRKHDFPEKGPAPGLEWMASHTRTTRPEKIVWQPVRPWKTTFYWLRWEDPWIGSEVTATLDRAQNRIDISVKPPRGPDARAILAERNKKLAGLSVYLDERMVDMTRDVQVTVASDWRFNDVPFLSLETLVRSAEEREDPEYVFAAEARTVSAVPK